MLKQIASLELVANDTIAGLVPWLAPIPTAYSVFRAGYAGLGWPAWVATLGALAIEGLGVSAASTAMMLYSYNQDKDKSQPSAVKHFALAVSAGGLYLISALALIGLVEVAGISGSARYVPLVFPFLSLAAVVILALRADHKRRLLANDNDKAERKAARKDSQAARSLRASEKVPMWTCASCGAEFAKQQSLAAHKRHCKSRNIANGQISGQSE